MRERREGARGCGAAVFLKKEIKRGGSGGKLAAVTHLLRKRELDRGWTGGVSGRGHGGGRGGEKKKCQSVR